MTSVYETFASNWCELECQLRGLGSNFQPIGEICSLIYDRLLPDLRFLTLFEDCINKLHEVGAVVLDLQEIASLIEGTEIQEIRKELRQLIRGHLSISILSRAKIWKRVSKYSDVFATLNAKINLLKEEIREACNNLLGQTFHPYYLKADFTHWELLSIISFLREFRVISANYDDLRIKVDDFLDHLSALKLFLHGLPYIPRAQDFSILVASVAIRAQLVFFQWWASQFDPNITVGTIILLSDVQRKINCTLPEPLAQMLRLLKALKRNDHLCFNLKVYEFACHVLPFNRKFAKIIRKAFWQAENLLPYVLTKEIESLTSFFVSSIPDEDAEDEEGLLLEFNLLISEVEEFFSCSLPENGSPRLNILAEVSLLKIEAFIREQLSAADDFPLPEKAQIGALNQGLQKTKELLERHGENVNKILTLMEVGAKLDHLHHSFHAKDITKDMVQTMLSLLRLNILPLKLESKFYHRKGSLMLVVKDTVQSLLEGLRFLINCVFDQAGVVLKDGVLQVAQTKAIAKSLISLHRLLLTQNSEDMMESVNLVLSDSQDEIKLIMARLREFYVPFPRSNFPKTNALAFYDTFLTRLRELLLNYKDNFFVSVKQNFEEISANLEFFRDCLGHILEITEEEFQELGNLGAHVVNAAYETEYLVHSIVSSDKSECYYLIWLYNLLQNIRHIRMQVARFNERKTYEVQLHNFPQISRRVVSKTSTPAINDILLSLNDQLDFIIDHLLGGLPRLDILSIVGMPGIGKTTLAKEVYNSPIVAYRFHIQAWCCVTEVYRKRELLLEILSHIIALTDSIRGMSDEDLEFKLLQLLRRKKYLIVMDDMWSTEAWDDLRTSFPDDENGSRILMTSRLNHVALKANAHSHAHYLRQLSDKESWKLLQMRIFGEEACPGELIKVGQEIAASCKGLPLAIVTIGGLLQRIERDTSQWKEIARNLSSRIVDDPQDQCREILELSYKLLPDHMRACFLYFGAFLEDQEIPVKKLIRLWISEGFVQESELKSLEDLAEDYLSDLIGRSLVVSSQPRFGGGTKTCRVHDMLRSLCQSKAKEDNFLQVITRSNESNSPDDDLDFLLNVNFRNPSNYKTHEDFRLCFYSTRNHFVGSRPNGPFVQSLLFFSTSEKYARISYDISFISHNFRHLKVLDFECINIGSSFPTGMDLMGGLRYLAVSGDMDSVPSSIAKLSNLETLLVKGLRVKVLLPDTIWCLKKLRHVQVSDVSVMKLIDDELGNSSVLEYLVTLSSPFLHYAEDTNNMLKKFPNLRKLACIFAESPECYGSYNLFPRLDVLTKLESLKITYYGRALHTAEFGFPFSLRKLTMSNFRLPWSEISLIGKLKNLEVLKLLSKAYEGEIWNMVEGEFSNLKFLKMDTLNIAKWNACSDNLPKLEHLVLRNCKHLEEVPSTFAEIDTLQMIEVQWCANSAEESVRRMRAAVDEHLKIIIASDLDTRSSL